MESIYSLIRELSIDESMILWWGKLIFRQYVQGKCQKYGIKLYMLTEPSGLVLKFLVYAGSGDKDVGGHGHVSNVVRKLLFGKLGLGYSVHMDNYYNSFDLTKYLLCENTYILLKKGEEVHKYSEEGIRILKWKDQREVLVISSEHDGSMVDTISRRGKTKSKPKIIAEYSKSMGGIDRQDQMLAYYPIERKTLQWNKKVGIHTFHIMLLNRFYLYNR